MRVARTLVYEGPPEWIKAIFRRNYVRGYINPGPNRSITEVAIYGLDEESREALTWILQPSREHLLKENEDLRCEIDALRSELSDEKEKQ